jgi:hypothetical protein
MMQGHLAETREERKNKSDGAKKKCKGEEGGGRRWRGGREAFAWNGDERKM